MKFTSTVVALSAAALAYAQSNLPIINTPASLVQCQPALISFSGGVAPYFLSILPAGQPAATPIAYLPDQPAAGSYTWTVNLAAGSNITLSIRDGSGQLNYAAPLVVQAGPDSSCVGVVVSGAATGAGAGSTAPVGTSTAVSSIATTAAPSSVNAVTSSASAATNASVTAASGTPTSTINGTSATFNFTCTQGLLTYGITVAELQGVPLSEVVAYTRNWTAAAPGTALNTTGTGVGATRAYQIGTNVTIEETLRLNSTNRTTGALHQQWNFTNATPVVFSPQLTLYDAFNDLTVYTNETSNVTSVQYFILGCFNDQAAGLTTLASLINESITYWAQQITMMGSNSTTSAAAVPAKVRRVVRL